MCHVCFAHPAEPRLQQQDHSCPTGAQAPQAAEMLLGWRGGSLGTPGGVAGGGEGWLCLLMGLLELKCKSHRELEELPEVCQPFQCHTLWGVCCRSKWALQVCCFLCSVFGEHWAFALPWPAGSSQSENCLFSSLCPIGNMDRHHYETFEKFGNETFIIHLDNGRG